MNSTEVVKKDRLVEVGLIKNNNLLVKLLSVSSGDFNSPLSFQLDAYSSSAKKLIEQVGGQIL